MPFKWWSVNATWRCADRCGRRLPPVQPGARQAAHTARYEVVRNEKTKTTAYELRLPLSASASARGGVQLQPLILDDDDARTPLLAAIGAGAVGRPAANPRYLLQVDDGNDFP